MKEKLNLSKMLNILILVYPLLIMTNPKLVINGINIILIVFFFFQIKKEGLKLIFIDKYIILFLIAIIISFIGSPYSISSGLNQLSRMLRWILLPLIIGQFRIENKTKKYLIYSMILGVFYYTFKFYEQIHLKKVLERNYGQRFSGGFRISEISLILGISCLILLILFLYTNISKLKKSLLIIPIIISLIMLILTQTRGMYVATFISVLLIFLLKNRKHFLVAILLVGLLFGGVVLKYPKNKYVKRVMTLKKIDTSNKGRIEVMKEAYRIGRENPINGVGYDNFNKAERKGIYKYNKTYLHPHNILLKLFSEAGLIGLAAYLLLIIEILKKSIFKREENIEMLLSTVVISCFFIYEMTDVVIIRIMPYSALFFLLAILFNRDYQNKKAIRFIEIKKWITKNKEK